MDSSDTIPQYAHFLYGPDDIVHAFLLCPQRKIRIHQMSRIQHESTVLMLCQFQQQLGQRGLAEGKPWPPKIFKQQHAFLRQAFHDRIHYSGRRPHDLLIAMEEPPAIKLAGSRIRHMKNYILRTTAHSLPNILPP